MSMVQKGELWRDFGEFRKETVLENKPCLGFLEIYIHQARDIRNICIYHKQDVYAKLSLTGDPETEVASQIINGGGKNPVFNEKIRMPVQKINSSLRCEIWMLSRIRNYLEDQLLGFVLVPISDILIGNGKLAQEFPLSSTELFHSPAGFVQLSLTYTGTSPEVMEVQAPSSSLAEIPESVPCELEKIEFPDPKIANENQIMVSKYFEIQSAEGDLQSSESGSEIFVHGEAIEVSKGETSPRSVSTEASPSASIPASSQSTADAAEAISSRIAKIEGAEKGVVSGSIEEEDKVLQQEIVDMYLKSMQQFTESLAKMKLPMDKKNESKNSEKSPEDNNPRVFYGSRAFF